MLQLRIMNQNISYYATSRIVADSQGYLDFTLETSEEWTEYVKVVQFTRDGKTYDVPDVRPGVQYKVPWEALVGGGTMFVSCYGMSGETNRATTNELEITVYDSGFYEGDPSEDPTPDKYQQFVGQVLDAKRDAETAAENAATSASAAEEAVKNVTNYADQAYKNAQLAQQAAQQATNAVGNAEIYSETAQEYAKQAEDSAVAAGESEINASFSEQATKQSEENAETYMESAEASKQEAILQADRAEANQIIVTETKAEIDEIYSDIQTRQEDITEKHQDINDKASIINTQYEQIQNYYQNFVVGCSYIEFSDALQSGDVEGWIKTEDTEDEYTITLDWGGNAILNVQIYDETTQQYYITNFADVVLSGNYIIIKAIYPFVGRVMYHALVEQPEVTINDTTN